MNAAALVALRDHGEAVGGLEGKGLAELHAGWGGFGGDWDAGDGIGLAGLMSGVLEVGPFHEVGEGGASVMTPCERGFLHLADGADAGDTP